MSKLAGPIIEERLQLFEQNGPDYPGRPVSHRVIVAPSNKSDQMYVRIRMT